MEKWLHYAVARDLKHGNKDLSTLEIGAGTLNHLVYETNISVYDVIEPYKLLFEDSPSKSRVRNIYSDISEIPADALYDRIISIAVFEHIEDLPKLIEQSILHLKPNGSYRVAIPNEGRFLWKLGWKLTTGIEFRLKYKLDYSVFLGHEHVNTADEIGEVLKYYFVDVKERLFGITKPFSFYRFYECNNPKANH
jgi:SAM-dependent methyltransferase